MIILKKEIFFDNFISLLWISHPSWSSNIHYFLLFDYKFIFTLQAELIALISKPQPFLIFPVCSPFLFFFFRRKKKRIHLSSFIFDKQRIFFFFVRFLYLVHLSLYITSMLHNNDTFLLNWLFSPSICIY